MSTATTFSDADREAARRIRAEYQRTHDLSGSKGRIAGIDPVTGEVWIDDWITDIVHERGRRGLHSPLWFERIGYPTCLRKGGRR